jgi:hypothetical protein
MWKADESEEGLIAGNDEDEDEEVKLRQPL